MSLDLTPQQQEIHSGLSRIGQEIANFYIDGIRMQHSNEYHSKSYLLGHVAREIDGGIRDILASEHSEKNNGKESEADSTDRLSHIESILFSLGLSNKSDFADKWHKVAKQFHKYAHRQGPFRESRDPSNIIDLWYKYEQILHKMVGSFLAITDRIDHILKFKSPTKGAISTLSNLLLDRTLEAYFYRNLSNPNWFIPLSDKGFFNTSKLRQSYEVEDGTRFIYWNQLFYFKNLIEKNPAGSLDKEIYSGLIGIAISLSKRNLDVNETKNPYIWHEVIEILSGIPIHYHTKRLYDYIPSWFDSDGDNLLASSDLINKLCPHVLEDEGSTDLKEYFLFNILKFREQSEYSYYNKFEFIFQNHWLGEDVAIESISSRIAEHLNVERVSEFFITSINQINWYQLSHSEIKFPDDESYRIVLDKNDSSIQIVLLKGIEESIWNDDVNAEHKEKYKISANRVWGSVLTAISEKEIPISKEVKDKIIESIDFFCEHDFNNEHLRKLSSIESHHREDTHSILIRLFHNILSKAARLNSERIISLFDPRLMSEQHDIFKRIVIQTIADAYDQLGFYFWKVVYSDQHKLLFSDSTFNEVYDLLKKNCHQFNEEQSKYFKKLLKSSSRNIDRNPKKWLFRYYSALRNNEIFKSDYDKLSEELNRTYKDVEESGQVKVNLRKDEAYSATDFDEIPIPDIAKRLLSFKPKGGWDDPDEDSIGIMLQNSCTKEPEKYSQNLSFLTNVPHIYIYYLLISFENLWNNDKDIEWKEILQFIDQYLDNPRFGDTKTKSSKRSSLQNYQLVLRSIGQLISSGTKSDNHAFDSALLPIAQGIVLKCMKWVDNEEDFKKTNMDYPMYLLNSTNGKVIESLILLSLRQARISNLEESTDTIEWEEDLRVAFRQLLSQQILEAYISLGFFFRNLMYLDANWTLERIIENQELQNELLWRAIVESYVFNSPIIDETEIYDAFKPYLIRYIEIADDKSRYSDIIVHYTGYVFLGYDSKIEESLILPIIASRKAFIVQSLIMNIWSNWKKDVFSIQSKRGDFEEYVIIIWKEIIKAYSNSESDDLKKCISMSTRFLSIFNQIDTRILPLMVKSCEYLHYGYDTYYIVEELHRLKDQGEPIPTANSILDIYAKMLEVTIPDYKPKHVQDTIDTIYANGDSSLQERCNAVCNIYASKGNLILREIYARYNSL